MQNLKGVSEEGPCQKEYQWGTGVLSLYSRHEEGLHVSLAPLGPLMPWPLACDLDRKL